MNYILQNVENILENSILGGDYEAFNMRYNTEASLIRENSIQNVCTSIKTSSLLPTT